ncbi:MAG: hypothetical protein CME65_01655 [Halobacteriovoraceae bacterium]|nr:hypothetical protein [Halobacteriovoraceae bacterium]|tara:strand:- start:961 stop:1527 length:567 start_codon:yes stop_codon:yes gene_type:complete
MKSCLFLVLFLIWTVAFAENCTYKMSAKDVNVSWVAFKTPLKIGVGGKFTKLGVKDRTAASFSELIQGIKFNIDTASTETGNKDRDKKIIKYFFENMDKSADISGTTLGYEKKVLKVRFNMNKYTRDVPLRVTKTDSSFEAIGVIDVFDFGLNKSLAGINKACEKLHEGKTWSDVEVKLEAKYSKTCK